MTLQWNYNAMMGNLHVLGCSVVASLGPSVCLMQASAAGAILSGLHTCGV